MTRKPAFVVAAALACAAAAPAHATAAAPKVDQLVAFPGGDFDQAKAVKAAATTAKVGRRRCAVAAATPLAALLRTEGRKLVLHDYGACSRKAADAGGIYVRSIKGHRAKGLNGWVYKVGQKLATAGSGDTSGPFGHGRLKSGQKVTWFYCRANRRSGSCQRTLSITKLEAIGGGQVQATVRAYDDRGRSKPAANVLVQSGDTGVKADSNGVATLSLPPGFADVHAEASGLVRSFEESVEVR
jgi:hypothetical protein